MTKSDVLSWKFRCGRGGVGPEIRKCVTRCACNIRGSERDYSRPCQANGPITLPARFFVARTCEGDMSNVWDSRPWKSIDMCHGAPKASLKTHRMRWGGSRSRRRRGIVSAVASSSFIRPTDMSNAGCITIYCPISEFTVRVYGSLFLASFRLSLPKVCGVFSAPVDERKSVSDRVPGHNNRAFQHERKFTYYCDCQINGSRYKYIFFKSSRVRDLGLSLRDECNDPFRVKWNISRDGQLDEMID